MDRDQRRAQEAVRLFEEQRARISTLDAAGIFGAAAFGAIMFWGRPLVMLWSAVLLSQVVAGVCTRRVREPISRAFELWWVSGSSFAWAALPLLAFNDARLPEGAWILTVILVFGIASDAVYLPQTYEKNVMLNCVAYSVPYLLVFAYHDMWSQVVLVLGLLIHVGWGAVGISGLVDDLISRRVDAVISAERAHLSARTDGLTGLLNRSGVMAELRQLAATGEVVHCVFVDLDDFKAVNDQFGYEAGDRLLGRLGLSLRAVFPSSWKVGRFGGDEFIAVGTDGDLDEIGRQLRALRIAPETGLFARRARFVHASAGVASLRIDVGAADDLVAHASAALQQAKTHGKSAVVVSDEAFRGELQQARRRAMELEQAIERGEFVAHLQHVVDLSTGRPCGVEVLARWERADEVVPPSMFLPHVEQQQLQRELDRAMLRRGIEVLEDLVQRGRDDLTVSVNIAASHLLDPTLPDFLRSRLERVGVPAERLILEVTESDDLAAGDAALLVATELRGMGVGLSIDDFGTGYSSMTQLLSFPFTEMKLDRSLVNRVGAPDADDLLTALCDFGRRHGLRVVAEGIEREDQLDAIRRLGVEVGQGFHFHRPAAADTALDALDGEDPAAELAA
jgi:diguanylate cyclase (GGDEF)-like protein